MNPLPPGWFISLIAVTFSVFGFACGSDDCPYETHTGTARVVEFDSLGAPPGADCADRVRPLFEFIDSSGKVNPTLSDAINDTHPAPTWVSQACVEEAGIAIGSEFDVEIEEQDPAVAECVPFKKLKFEEDLLVCNSSCGQ